MLKTFLVVISFLISCNLKAQFAEGYSDGFNSITSAEILESITFLASDSLKGRATGTQENLLAAMYIAGKFKLSGLLPLIKNNRVKSQSSDYDLDYLDVKDSKIFNEYFQRFVVKKSSLSENNSLGINSKKGKAQFREYYDYKADFIVQKNSPENITSELEIVFAGYGIIDVLTGYNDYLDENGNTIDVSNKAVVIIDSYPNESNPSAEIVTSKNIVNKNIRKKAELAESMGAAALIVASSALLDEPPLMVKHENLLKAFTRQIYYIPEITGSSIPVFYVNTVFVEDLLENNSFNLKEFQSELDRTLKPQAFNILDKTISFSINFDTETIITQNVVGMIEGNDPELKDEFLIIGAHYDHIGLGSYGTMDRQNKGKIHNGADDNASGTSGIIELAEAFSKSKPKRSIIILAFSAEENGLLGSKYYSYYQPLKPLENTVSMLNLDMIGRNEQQSLWIGGVFYSDDMRYLIEEANQKTGFNLFYNVGLLSTASDQAPFLRKEIPAAFFFAGMHDDYHMPSDDVEKINPVKVEQVTKLAFMTGWIIANNDKKPSFRPLTNDEKAALVKESLNRQKQLGLRE